MTHWKDKEIAFIRENAATMTDMQIGQKLGRSYGAVRLRRIAIGLHKQTGGDVQTGEPRPLQSRSLTKDSRYFDVHALDCWITGTAQ